jgi:hypothetical protein
MFLPGFPTTIGGWNYQQESASTSFRSATRDGACGSTDWTIRSGAGTWLGQAATQWFTQRGLPIPPSLSGDIQSAPLFPVLPRSAWKAEFIQWLISGTDDRYAG